MPWFKSLPKLIRNIQVELVSVPLSPPQSQTVTDVYKLKRQTRLAKILVETAHNIANSPGQLTKFQCQLVESIHTRLPCTRIACETLYI